MRAFRYFPALLPAMFAPAAYAADSTSLPEPSSLGLLAIGVVGVIVGRRLSRKGPQE